MVLRNWWWQTGMVLWQKKIILRFQILLRTSKHQQHFLTVRYVLWLYETKKGHGLHFQIYHFVLGEVLSGGSGGGLVVWLAEELKAAVIWHNRLWATTWHSLSKFCWIFIFLDVLSLCHIFCVDCIRLSPYLCPFSLMTVWLDPKIYWMHLKLHIVCYSALESVVVHLVLFCSAVSTHENSK